MAIEAVTDIEKNFFDIQLKETRSRATRPDLYTTKLQIMFTLNADVTLFERDVYDFFMLLGNVGGFSGILFSFGAAFVSLLTYKNSENYLASKLYQTSVHEKKGGKTSNKLNPRAQLAFKEYLQEKLPAFCTKSSCLKKSKPDRDF